MSINIQNSTIKSNLDTIDCILQKTKLFIFDLDGTMADTEPLHWEAYNILLNKKYNFSLNKNDIKGYIGNNEVSIYKMIEKDYNISIDTVSFLKERLDIYLKLVKLKKLQPFNWVIDFFKKYTNIPIILLTSQVPKIVDFLLDYWNLSKFIPKSMRISVHNGKITKKEVFKNPSKFVNINKNLLKENITIFEDSNHVAKIAKEIGYTVIGIIHKYNKNTITYCDFFIEG